MCQVLLAILALFLPPIAVLLDQGCTCDLLINILLTCLGIIPGIIHAWYLILCKEKYHTNVYIQTHNNQGTAPPAYTA
ncbi:hypothetical protein CAEBREN_10484 [Caenorhabditis brenneri]|uniref:Uncharacterized protein n=1 Tax=Caenorhabditis brenneri TaxID=135651 RepID=G0MKC4_CAEBE|nr:hypothetical protein CAEBREN_10484 [Caenorhabditis brenneri]